MNALLTQWDSLGLLLYWTRRVTNEALLQDEIYLLMQMIRGRDSLNLYLRYRGRHIEQAAQIL